MCNSEVMSDNFQIGEISTNRRIFRCQILSKLIFSFSNLNGSTPESEWDVNNNEYQVSNLENAGFFSVPLLPDQIWG